MTPLHAFLSRRLPAPLVRLAMMLVYALLIAGIALTIGLEPADVMYVDVPERR